MNPLRSLVREAVATLTEAGVASPRADAVALVAHVLGVGPGELERRLVLGEELSEEGVTRFRDLVAERAARVPLQHLTGRAAFRRLTLHVGPGVFVPRPETEGVAGLAIEALAGRESPIAVDLCTGSGALALALADEVPGARVLAVEVDRLALAWTARNVAATGLPVEVLAADATAPPEEEPALAELLGSVDVVVSNPPYVPQEMVPVDPEVAEHDPAVALFGGSADGLRIPLAVAATAARLLRPGGLLVMEHADEQGESLPAALTATGAWTDVTDHRDLAGRPRAVTASRCIT
nr:peptide chain release factor N(5)-glutamine methyltransferase [Janibacter corallicola]